MVFISRGAVRVALYPADRGIFQVHDHRMPGGKLAVQLFQALGAGAGVPGVACGGPHRTVRPHPAAGAHLAVQNGAGVAQRVQAALAGGLVADGKDVAGVEAEQPDAVFLLQFSGVGMGQKGAQQQNQRQNCRRQPLCRAGGTVLHGYFLQVRFNLDMILPLKRGENV